MPKGHWKHMGKKTQNEKLCFLQAIYLQCIELIDEREIEFTYVQGLMYVQPKRA